MTLSLSLIAALALCLLGGVLLFQSVKQAPARSLPAVAVWLLGLSLALWNPFAAVLLFLLLVILWSVATIGGVLLRR
jgi:hypothetical protein